MTEPTGEQRRLIFARAEELALQATEQAARLKAPWREDNVLVAITNGGQMVIVVDTTEQIVACWDGELPSWLAELRDDPVKPGFKRILVLLSDTHDIVLVHQIATNARGGQA